MSDDIAGKPVAKKDKSPTAEPGINAADGTEVKPEEIKPKEEQPETEYRHDEPPSKPHYDPETGRKEPNHWHYRNYDYNPNTGKWVPGSWTYGGPGAPPG